MLQVGKPDGKIVSGVVASCKLHDLPYELLDADAVRRRYPAFALDDDEVAAYEPEGGFLRPERAITVALKLAGADGAVLHFNERVRATEPDDVGVTIVSDEADRASAGARSLSIDLRKNDVAVDSSPEDEVRLNASRSLSESSLESKVCREVTGLKAQ